MNATHINEQKANLWKLRNFDLGVMIRGAVALGAKLVLRVMTVFLEFRRRLTLTSNRRLRQLHLIDRP
jgi:hypothetical protein